MCMTVSAQSITFGSSNDGGPWFFLPFWSVCNAVTYPEYSPANSYPWIPFPPRRARPRPGPHSHHPIESRTISESVMIHDIFSLDRMPKIACVHHLKRLKPSRSRSGRRMKAGPGSSCRVGERASVAITYTRISYCRFYTYQLLSLIHVSVTITCTRISYHHLYHLCDVSRSGRRTMAGPASSCRFGFRVSGFGFRASGFGFRVSGFGFRVSGFGFRVSGFGFRVSGFGLRVSGFGFRVSGSGFRGGR